MIKDRGIQERAEAAAREIVGVDLEGEVPSDFRAQVARRKAVIARHFAGTAVPRDQTLDEQREDVAVKCAVNFRRWLNSSTGQQLPPWALLPEVEKERFRSEADRVLSAIRSHVSPVLYAVEIDTAAQPSEVQS